MRVQYARTKSDVVAKLDGTFVPRPKNNLKLDPTKAKRQKVTETAGTAGAGAPVAPAAPMAKNPLMANPMMANPMMGANPMMAANPAMMGGMMAPVVGFCHENFFHNVGVDCFRFLNSKDWCWWHVTRKQEHQEESRGVNTHVPQLPNETLFVQNLPRDAKEELLRMLFSQYPGFKEVRYIESRQCAFIEYITEMHATHALNSLRHIEIRPGQKMDLTYMRK